MTPRRPTLFGLLRHAETCWNRENRIQGQQDSALTRQGRDSARDWGRLLAAQGWQRIVASDLERAQHTAARINETLRLPLALDPRLREQDWGRWTGRRLREVRDSEGLQAARILSAGWDFHPPQGEARRAVLARAMEALHAAAARWPGERILLVSHEGLIKPVLYHLLERQTEMAGVDRQRVKANHVHHLSSDGRHIVLLALNAHALPQRLDRRRAMAAPFSEP
jgi:probable phosphoglycerate mutase